MKLVTSRQMAELEALAASKYKISNLELMEHAGKKVADIVASALGEHENVLVIAGKGNNGGDALASARYLLNRGIKAKIVLTEIPQKLSPLALKEIEWLKGREPQVHILGDEDFSKELSLLLDQSDVIVDGIFGTGLRGELTPRYKRIVEIINASGKKIVSIDIPSGISSDTGEPLGSAVRADMVVSLGLPKIGVVLARPLFAKEVCVVDIGLPKELIDSLDADNHLITPDLFVHYIGKRPETSHKGDFGHVLVLAGSLGKIGAGWLVSRAALRSGAGLVTYGMPEGAYGKFDVRNAEIMVEPISDKRSGYFTEESIEVSRKISEGKSVIAIGPGIGTARETQAFVKGFILRTQLTLVLDADGINSIADNPAILKRRQGTTILTPHPGEMGRLLGVDSKTVNASRISIARRFAKEYGVFLVLKGHRSIVATPKGEVYINPTGNPGMATAGMGDALTGVIAAFVSEKLPPLEASLAGVYIHGLAGDLSMEAVGDIGIIASDLIERIPKAIQVARERLGSQRVI